MTARPRSMPGAAPAGILPAATGRSGWMLPLGGAAVVAAVMTAGALDPHGPLAAVDEFLEYYSGVFSLVALSITVMVGLVATDRLVLMIRHRVLLQAAHRATALTATIFLVVHIAMKVTEGHARPWDVVVPFLNDHRTVHIGLGSVAAYLMVLAAWTGVVRRRFATHANPGLWRALHASAYVSWIVSLVHGLNSGRSAATWVTVSYAVCVLLVCLLLLVRVCLSGTGRSPVARARTLGTTPASGRRAPTPVLYAAEIPLTTPVDARPYAGMPAAREMPFVREASTGWDIPAARNVPPPDGGGSDDGFWSYLRGGAAR